MEKQFAFTLRLDPDLYKRVKLISKREGRSITAFVKEAVTEKLADDETASLYRAFTLVGEDSEETDVDFAGKAQSEVVLKDE